ncbi:MAG: sigma-70 family RNA polymerase sigma factor [Pirellulaceae bacterium]
MQNQEDETTIDERLAIRCQLGDRTAWEEFVGRWNPRLNHFLCRMINDPVAVEDLSQTIWLKVVRSLPQLNDPQKLGAWIYRIARTAVTDRLRTQYRSPITVVRNETDPPKDDFAINQFIESENIAAAMQKLHPEDREAITLHYFHHLPVADIAEVCNVPSGTIKSRMNRARKALRHILESGDQS